MLNLLVPNHPLLKYFKDDLADDTVYAEFTDRFRDQSRGAKGDGRDGGKLFAFCMAQYFLTLKREIMQILIPVLGPVQYLFKSRSIDSDTWADYWQRGADGLMGGMPGVDHGNEMNSELSLLVPLKLDPRMIVGACADGCSISLLVEKAISDVVRQWGAEWSYQGVEYGESVITITNLLSIAVGKDRHAGLSAFGIPSYDRERGRSLIQGMLHGEPVMEALLKKQIFEAIPFAHLTEQIERAPKT